MQMVAGRSAGSVATTRFSVSTPPAEAPITTRSRGAALGRGWASVTPKAYAQSLPGTSGQEAAQAPSWLPTNGPGDPDLRLFWPVVSTPLHTGHGQLNSFTPTFAIDLASPGPGSVRVQVRGDVDLSTSPELGDTLTGAIDGGNSVVLDLSEVTFIDSTGLNTLIRALKACETNGGALALGPKLPAQVSRVFEITGLDDLFPTAPQ